MFIPFSMLFAPAKQLFFDPQTQSCFAGANNIENGINMLKTL
jgi:hypothetical protein